MIAVVAGFVLVCGGSVTAAAIWLVNNAPGDDLPGGPSADPGGPEDPTGPIAWWPRTAPGGETTLDQLWPELADEFTATAQSEIRLEPTPQEDYSVRLATAIAAGVPPDLFYSAGGDVLRQQVEDGLVRDLTDDLADVIATVSPGALAPYTVDGRVYGLPYHMGMAGLWYNKALFSDAGLDPDRPPETWDEFLDAVAALKEAGTTPIALGGVETWTASFWFGYLATRVAGVDGIAQARQQRSFSDNPDLLRAAQLLEDLVALEPFQPGFEAAPYVGPGGQASLMGNGEAAMELMGNWAPLLHEVDAPGGLGEDLGWFRFPAVSGGKGSIGDVYGGGDGFVVGADAPDQTLELLRFLFSEQNYQRILDSDPNLMPVGSGAQPPPGDPNLAAQLATIQAAPAFQLYLDQDLPAAVGVTVFESTSGIVTGRLDAGQALSEITAAYQSEPD